MSRKKIIAAIDIGSSSIKTIIGEDVSSEGLCRVIGYSAVPSFGIRRGQVADIEEVAKSIAEGLGQAEKMAGVSAENAIVSICSSDIVSKSSKGVVAIGRADGEVAEDDVSRVLGAAQTISIPPNREIIYISPRSFRLDDQENIKDPIGMRGVRLEVDALIIEASVPQIKSLTKSVYQAGLEIDDLVLESLASARAVLSKRQKELGVAVINLGGTTTSLSIYEEGELIYTSVIPVGSSHITNDIAIGIRSSIEVAEKIKLEYGCATSREINRKDEIDLAKIDSQEEGVVFHYHIAEIIEARLEEIFTMINKELKSIGKAGLLPAGAVLTGGGAKMPQIIEMAKSILGLPAQIGYPERLGGILDKVDDPSFSAAVGMILWVRDEESSAESFISGPQIIKEIRKGAGSTIEKIKGWIENILP